jgi:hypothetical protein
MKYRCYAKIQQAKSAMWTYLAPARFSTVLCMTYATKYSHGDYSVYPLPRPYLDNFTQVRCPPRAIISQFHSRTHINALLARH